MAINDQLRKLSPLAFTEFGELKSLDHQLMDLRAANDYPYPLIVCGESRMIPDEEYQFMQVNRVATVVARSRGDGFFENTLRHLAYSEE